MRFDLSDRRVAIQPGRGGTMTDQTTGKPYGYAGKYLLINLTEKKVEKLPLTEEMYAHIGGMGICTHLLSKYYRKGLRAYDPDNPIIFFTGALTGTLALTASRTAVVSMSPQTKTIGMSNFGGFWGSTLKYAGYDGIVIEGKSSELVYVCIEDDTVEILDASHLKGKDAWDATDAIKEGQNDIKVAAIGQAGENLVEYTAITAEYFNSASRCGLGGVLGSKNLKAIAVKGAGGINIFEPEKMKQEVLRNLALAKASKNPFGLKSFNFIKELKEAGAFPNKNYHKNISTSDASNLKAEIAKEYITNSPNYRTHDRACHSCPYGCFMAVELTSGKYKGLKNAGMVPAFVMCWSGKCEINNYPAIWKCEEMCNRLGLDIFSVSSMIAYYIDLFEAGILTEKETDGLTLRYGDEDTIMKLLVRIANAEGKFAVFLGKNLANLTNTGEACVKMFGKEITDRIREYASGFNPSVKGMEMLGFDPRTTSLPYLVGEIFSLRGGDNVTTNHHVHFILTAHTTTDEEKKSILKEMKIPDELKEKIFTSGIIPDTPEGIARLAIWMESFTTLLNNLGTCILEHMALDFCLAYEYYSDLYYYATGRKITVEQLADANEKTICFQKQIGIDAGYTMENDTWDDKFFNEKIADGPFKGRILNRAFVDEIVKKYYELRGW